MTEPANTSAAPGSLREQAATWFAIMRGPEAEVRRAEFEIWLDTSAFHREAYNRIAETFSLGKTLKLAAISPVAPATPPEARADRRRAMALVFLVAAAAIGLTVMWMHTALPPAASKGGKVIESGNAGESARSAEIITSRVGEIRQVKLADGSTVTLDTDSMVEISLGSRQRRLTLVKGRARFAVAHEKRPFLVATSLGTVRAVGTLFDVSLTQGRVDVRLLSGVIDVAIKPSSADGGAVRRLVAGEALRFGGGAKMQLSTSLLPGDTDWPKGLRDFDGARLGDVIADANRYATVPLRVRAQDVADLRVSGRFRIDDTPNLAANLAEVLGLMEVREQDGIALMRQCPTDQQNCRPPS